MHIISLWIGKSIVLILKLFHRRGAALPGLIVERIDTSFLPTMINTLPQGVIVVSGTNGKTTSTKMLSAILSSSGKKVLTNPTGSNFTRGIIAAIVAHATWSGRLPYDIAVIELDEAYAAKFVQQVKPRACLLLNVMRDQMDRFGEIDHTALLLQKVVEKTTDLVVLNRDDERVYALHAYAKAPVELFGVDNKLRDVFRSDDELHTATIDRKNIRKAVELQTYDDEKITIKINSETYEFPLSLYGVYNAQNATAVVCMAYALGLHPKDISRYLKSVTPAFGRGERIIVGTKKVVLQLVKNPGGFRHALMGASSVQEDYTLIAINDDYADGRDVSWLWDVTFSDLKHNRVSTSGVRAADMALRLQYDNVPVVDVEPDVSTALKEALLQTPEGGVLHIYTTYTAMLKLRQLLSTITKVEAV